MALIYLQVNKLLGHKLEIFSWENMAAEIGISDWKVNT